MVGVGGEGQWFELLLASPDMGFNVQDDSQVEDSVPPSARSFHTKSKGVAVVVTALAALVTAIASLIRASDTSITEESYKTLSTAVEKLSQDNAKNHQDIESVMSYLEDDREARKKAADRVLAEAASAVKPRFAPPSRSSQPLKPILPPVPPPTPTSNAEPVLIRNPTFEEIKEKAK